VKRARVPSLARLRSLAALSLSLSLSHMGSPLRPIHPQTLARHCCITRRCSRCEDRLPALPTRPERTHPHRALHLVDGLGLPIGPPRPAGLRGAQMRSQMGSEPLPRSVMLRCCCCSCRRSTVAGTHTGVAISSLALAMRQPPPRLAEHLLGSKVQGTRAMARRHLLARTLLAMLSQVGSQVAIGWGGSASPSSSFSSWSSWSWSWSWS